MPPLLTQQVRTRETKGHLFWCRSRRKPHIVIFLHMIDSSSLAAISHLTRRMGLGEFILSRLLQWIWSCSSLAYAFGTGANVNDLQVFERRTKKNGTGISIIRLKDEHGRSAKS
jgi:hypothetical protein